MKLYVVTLLSVERLSERIVKIFSTYENLDKWMQCAKLMDKELFGNLGRDITKEYKVTEHELDNLDFIELVATARSLGAQVKPSEL